VPTIGQLKAGVCISSTGDLIGIGIYGDDTAYKDPWEFQEILDRKFKEGLDYCLSQKDKKKDK